MKSIENLLETIAQLYAIGIDIEAIQKRLCMCLMDKIGRNSPTNTKIFEINVNSMSARLGIYQHDCGNRWPFSTSKANFYNSFPVHESLLVKSSLHDIRSCPAIVEFRIVQIIHPSHVVNYSLLHAAIHASFEKRPYLMSNVHSWVKLIINSAINWFSNAFFYWNITPIFKSMLFFLAPAY